MNIITNNEALREQIRQYKQSGKSIGFVPTMGYLHEGHLSLIEEARKNHDIVVLSIFVNPLQFGPNEDFERYPRDAERDRKLAEHAGVDLLFMPVVDEIYPTGLSVTMLVKERVDVMCGRKREGHFDGVVTVLTKLFHLVQPDSAYFGMKDAQQVAVVEGLVQDYFFPIEIVRVPTIREEDGLAKSSRNVYLSPQERREAPILFKSLQLAKGLVERGHLKRDSIIRKVTELIHDETSGTVDYVEIYSFPQMVPVEPLQGDIIIALAVQFDKARLIDNMIISLGKKESQHV
ncbi:pantoate--beta-alanine ligase [Rossellomorea aquimaris]|uniref:pantoate--beta-alanine ligase n=1 Tax=Rossellomorea aquimaris TaxID=189382 RepID=UPI001CD4989B|nr:pantoate--beta-alanine ligase [Rossellomorea aquimaris]MCA1054613.1 pantoate--beta-alanine ligase [Rossellomorea aquimaris]